MLGVRVHGSGQGQAVWYRKGGVMCNKRRGVRVSGRGQGQAVWCRKGEVMCRVRGRGQGQAVWCRKGEVIYNNNQPWCLWAWSRAGSVV